jgi:hypothetical protein
MSVKAMTWAFEQPISGNEKVVLLALADFANDGGECWPSVRRIAEKAYISELTVRRIIALLIDSEFLKLTRRQSNDGRSMSNLYQLQMEEGEGVQSVPLPYHSCDRGRGSTVIPTNEPSYEPSVNNNIKGKVKKACRLPEDFMPDASCLRLAEELGMSAQMENIKAAFFDYWRSAPGQRGVKLDWQATFRKWLRNQQQFNWRKGNAQKSTNSITNSFAVVDAVLAERERQLDLAEESARSGGEDTKLIS